MSDIAIVSSRKPKLQKLTYEGNRIDLTYPFASRRLTAVRRVLIGRTVER